MSIRIEVVHQKYRNLSLPILKSLRKDLNDDATRYVERDELTQDYYQCEADIRILNDLIEERITS